MIAAQELLEKLTVAGVQITITSESRLKINAPKNTLSAAQREQLKLYKADLLALLSQKSGKQTVLDVCPLCGANLIKEDSQAIFVRFCPFDCSFTYRALSDWTAARKLANEMFDAANFDEYEAMRDSLDERTAILMLECSLDYETAMRRAEADLIPLWLNEYQTAQKFK